MSRVGNSLSRRQLVVGTTAAGLGSALPVIAGAQSTPNANASPAALDADLVLRVSQSLVGGGTLEPAAATGLATLLAAEPGIEASLKELAAITEMTPEALQGASAEAQAVATNILTYWFQGRYNDAPAPNRSDIFFQLASWQALPYLTQPTLCKAFGYWAVDVMPS